MKCGFLGGRPFDRFPGFWVAGVHRAAHDVGQSQGNMMQNKSVKFFDTQFQKQDSASDFVLNPFEQLALNYLKGNVLDLGCGLGNLSLEAGRRGHQVVAVDASPTAVARIQRDAQREKIAVQATQADVSGWVFPHTFDTILVIGLLSYFQCNLAMRLLQMVQEHVNPGGRTIINVLLEGTTYQEMFDGEGYHLFQRQELEQRFAGWEILVAQEDSFPAPLGTAKKLFTLVAEKPQRGN